MYYFQIYLISLRLTRNMIIALRNLYKDMDLE